MQYERELKDGFETAMINHHVNSNLAYRPEFISNDYHRGKNVISSLEQELSNCEEFLFSVAFITMGGVTPLLQTLKELAEKGIPGRILTTDYEMFNDPAALEKLHSLENLEIRMYPAEGGKNGFHTKGYIFRRDGLYHIIVGSSNLTANALKVNREWNTKLAGYDDGEMIQNVLLEFENLWNDSLAYEDFIEDYRLRWDLTRRQREIARATTPVSLEQYRLQPNSMQTAFVRNLMDLVSRKENKALLISATGTGKTYASAFGLREMNPEKVLFLVHREQIAKQAMESYKKVFGPKREDGTPYRYALLSGSTAGHLQEIRDADLIFSTMQMMCKDNVMQEFKADAFTAICLDEAHHSGAESYRKIMRYFTPDFWLGMTASPETNRFDVYEIFDHNIAYELRLQQAMEENLLCPFHYFGITDVSVNGEVIGDEDNTTGLRQFNRLVCDDRVNYVLEQAAYYGHDGDRVKGLIFCSRREEAKELSRKFNKRGLRTEVLTGEDPEDRRESVIERLVMDVSPDNMNEPEHLDYIFSVDIFSEGVDIPEINQVIMLRPTQSAIVFVQQLGRGLRKAPGKEYVVVLDFIGNYRNNFLIPIALSGDRSYNKDNIRRYIMEGDRVIPGVSTIHFDEVSRKRIYTAIDDANFSDIKLIRENYTNLKYKLGRIPGLKDFDDYGEMDVCRIFDNGSLGSYYKFLVKYEKDYKVRLTGDREKVVEFISKKLANGKRVQELEVLDILLSCQHGIMRILEENMALKYGITMSAAAEKSVINVMTNEFPAGSGKKTYDGCIFLEPDANGDDYHRSRAFSRMLEDENFRDIVEELVEFGISRYKANYSETYQDTGFVLYRKYTYEDVCRLLNWENNEVPLNIGGYKFDRKTKTFPVFINYDKTDDITDTTKYEDHFENEGTLIAISKSGRTIESDDVQNFLYAKERGIAVHLLVRKNKDDKISKEFYYLGKMSAADDDPREFTMPNTTKTAVEIKWNLDTPVRDDIYQYIVS